ncbi:MAG: hypothetical protein AAFY71_11350 [Bacteroidota bacterium]
MKATILSLLAACLLMGPVNRTYHPEKMITDFRQGNVKIPFWFKVAHLDFGVGNCASVALIKAALTTYQSVEDVFESYEEKDGQIFVTFRSNGKAYVIKADLWKKIKRFPDFRNGFQGESSYKEDAIKLFAIMCHVYHKKNNTLNPVRSAYHLNSGYDTSKIPALLGLEVEMLFNRSKEGQVPEGFSQRLKREESVVVWSGEHAAFMSKGVQDDFGQAAPFKNNMVQGANTSQARIQGAYILKK